MAKAKIVDSNTIKRTPRVAPATRLIESVPDGYMTTREVADYFDVNIETVRRLARAKNSDGKKRFKAPSKAARSGELVIWLYTEDDMEELAEHFGARAPKKRAARKRG